MSEYQYYAFQAIDAPLDAEAQQALRNISTRARITAAQFVNHYEWGDLKGDPRDFMDRWFDLHVYLSNWGTRRLMIRWPAGVLDRAALAPFLRAEQSVTLQEAGDGERVILDIFRGEEDGIHGDDGMEENDAAWLAALAPLRAEVAAGDLRLFYLVWLMAVQDGTVADDVAEPLPGIAAVGAALESCIDFFGLDPDLVQAAAGQGAPAPGPDAPRRAVDALSAEEKTMLLHRVASGDPCAGAELAGLARAYCPPPPSPRTAGALRALAQASVAARKQAQDERDAAARRRREEEAQHRRRTRLDTLRQRGTRVWDDVEAEIVRRNPTSYDRAVALLAELAGLADADGTRADFDRRLAAIRRAHQAKVRFIERLDALRPA